MHIYHALINALSAHMIHINLNMILYTHVEHSPTKTIYIKYYTKQNKQTNKQKICIKMRSDESQFSVSLIVRDKVTRQCPHWNHNFWRTSMKRKAKRNRTEVPLLTSIMPLTLGQTVSLLLSFSFSSMVLCFNRNHKDGQMELGKERLYTYRYTVTTKMTPALRWATMRTNLMFHELWGTKSQGSVHKPQLSKREDSRSRIEPTSFWAFSLKLPA